MNIAQSATEIGSRDNSDLDKSASYSHVQTIRKDSDQLIESSPKDRIEGHLPNFADKVK